MPPISLLIKPASGNCNLRCQYCFYYDTMNNRTLPSYGMMSEETLENVIKEALAFAEGSCNIAYQGGEPTLRGLDFFIKSIQFQKKYNKNKVNIQNALQTNGYSITLEWADFFRENNFLVGLSLDGLPSDHDKYRKNSAGQGSFSKVMETAELFKRRKVEFNILTVVNKDTARDIKKIYNMYKKKKLHYLQFIACLDPIGELPGSREYSLDPNTYGEFLCSLFDLWYEDLLKGEQPYIRQFENYISIIIGRTPESCEQRGICGLQYVVEADGSVFPCDFYVTDDFYLGNLNHSSIENINQKCKEIKFIENSMNISEECRNCSFYPLCRSGCRRNRIEVNQQLINRFCQSYKMFLTHSLPRLEEIAETISSNYSGN